MLKGVTTYLKQNRNYYSTVYLKIKVEFCQYTAYKWIIFQNFTIHKLEKTKWVSSQFLFVGNGHGRAFCALFSGKQEFSTLNSTREFPLHASHAKPPCYNSACSFILLPHPPQLPPSPPLHLKQLYWKEAPNTAVVKNGNDRNWIILAEPNVLKMKDSRVRIN